jgi:hypothetical protein
MREISIPGRRRSAGIVGRAVGHGDQQEEDDRNVNVRLHQNNSDINVAP